MADLINRDHAAQAIEAYLCSQCDYDTDRDSECIACPHLDGGEILKSVPAVNRWIQCAERLPENRERVLVCFRSGTVHIAVWYGDYDEKGAWEVTSKFPTKLYRTYTIPKWMPMPDACEPPEGGACDAEH